MSGIISKGLHDCSHLRLVSVIASFDASGSIMPLYVRIDGESLKIYNAVLTKASTYKLYIFDCEVMDGDMVKPLRLTYHLDDTAWSIPTRM